MSLSLGYFHTSDGPQIAVGENEGGGAFETVVVLSETDADGLTPGQLAFKHNVPAGNDNGHFSVTKG